MNFIVFIGVFKYTVLFNILQFKIFDFCSLNLYNIDVNQHKLHNERILQS